MKLKKLFKNLNYKSELIIFALINVVFIFLIIAFYVFLKNIIYCGLAIILLVVANLINVYRIYKTINNKQIKNISELSIVLNSIVLSVCNGKDLISAFKDIKDITDIELNRCVNNLIDASKDNQTITPFLAFAHNYSSIKIEELIIGLYCVNIKSIDSINELYHHMDEINRINNAEKNKQIDSVFDFTNLFPIVGVMIMLVIVVICIVLNIQGK